MKTTLEIPDSLFRLAKSVAAEKGIPLRALVSEAGGEVADSGRVDKPWLKSFGKLRSLTVETSRLNRSVEAEFEKIKCGDW